MGVLSTILFKNKKEYFTFKMMAGHMTYKDLFYE